MYYADTYEAQVRTRVAATGERDGVPWVAVEHCLFHPQDGGLPADRGRVDGHEIVPARDHDAGLVVARSASDLPLPDFTVGAVGRGPHRPGRAQDAPGAAHRRPPHRGGRAGPGLDARREHPLPGVQARIKFTAARPDPRLDTPEGRQGTTRRCGRTSPRPLRKARP